MSKKLVVDGLLVPIEKDTHAEYLLAAATRLNVSATDIALNKVLFKSLNTVDKKQFFYELSLVIQVSHAFENKDQFVEYADNSLFLSKKEPVKPRPIIIGFGPAGMFAALALIERGQPPIIFERGKTIEQRHLDIQKFLKNRLLLPESNIQFGEGGAGLYSDGKIFSGVNNSVYTKKVLDTFVAFGAPPEIRFINKPHLGTDMLCTIVANIKKYILEHGGELHYNSKMTDIMINNGKCSAIVINDAKEYPVSSVYLAIGNSARDTFMLLHRKGIVLESKTVSMGVRIEHPAQTINFMQYGEKYQNFPGLGAANYSFTYTNRNIHRTVYTFCMCPGGEVVNASSEEGMLAINGMSYAARNAAFSNSAIVVTGMLDDFKSNHPLAGIFFQREIERKAFLAGGGNWKAPAQNLKDFLQKKQSATLKINSFKMGAHSVSLDTIFPSFICTMLREAFNVWKTEHPIFVSDEALLFGAETRTSSPVRIKRRKNFESVSLRNLYPIGEGSGYSGGINSAAIDALRAVEKVIEIH
jgi:uncharacterized protein